MWLGRRCWGTGGNCSSGGWPRHVWPGGSVASSVRAGGRQGGSRWEPGWWWGWGSLASGGGARPWGSGVRPWAPEKGQSAGLEEKKSQRWILRELQLRGGEERKISKETEGEDLRRQRNKAGQTEGRWSVVRLSSISRDPWVRWLLSGSGRTELQESIRDMEGVPMMSPQVVPR